MQRSFRFAFTPRWIALHILVLAAVVAMILLGRWQLDVSNRKGFSLQNSAYSVQWWAFALFAIFFWYRVIRDHAKRPPTTLADQQPEVLPYRPYLPPTAVRSGDEVHGAYNDYLAQLAQSDRRKGMIDE